jgi:hypothetical protein
MPRFWLEHEAPIDSQAVFGRLEGRLCTVSGWAIDTPLLRALKGSPQGWIPPQGRRIALVVDDVRLVFFVQSDPHRSHMHRWVWATPGGAVDCCMPPLKVWGRTSHQGACLLLSETPTSAPIIEIGVQWTDPYYPNAVHRLDEALAAPLWANAQAQALQGLLPHANPLPATRQRL